MNGSDKYKAVRVLIRDAQIKEAVNQLTKLLAEDGFKALADKVDGVQARYSKNENDHIKGVLNFEQYSTESNRVRNALLIITNEAQEKANSVFPNASLDPEQQFLIFDERRKRKAQVFFSFVSVITFLLCLFEFFIGPRVAYLLIDQEHLKTTIHTHNWITYEPRRYWPGSGKPLDLDAINQELDCIKNAGFDGLITFTSERGLSKVPQIASEKGFAVIMGVFDPENLTEIDVAIKNKDYVDGYFIGFGGWPKSYTLRLLKKRMQKLRFKTRKPVSTLERFNTFRNESEFIKISDWVFTDAHLSLRDTSGLNSYRVNAMSDAAKTIEFGNEIARHEANNGKPVLLMITYPMNGITKVSLDEQEKYYRSIFELFKDSDNPLHSNVKITVHNTFDQPWKGEGIFYSWSRYIGLFEEDCTPRPAVRVITRNY